MKLGHKGSQGYLSEQQRQSIIDGLKEQEYWNLSELQDQLWQQYGVRFKSRQSYYDLFHAAGLYQFSMCVTCIMGIDSCCLFIPHAQTVTNRNQ